MFAAMSASIFVAGGGAAIIGGLYTRWGTTAGAWSGMIVGMTLCVLGVVITNVPQEWVDGWNALESGAVLNAWGGCCQWVRTNLTGMVISFIAMIASCVSYVTVSLAGGTKQFDLDRLLHRGAYRTDGDAALDEAPATFWEKIGFDRQYKGWDRFVAWITLSWPLCFTLLFCIGTPWMVWRKSQGTAVTDAEWSAYWHVWTWVILVASTAVMVWFVIGGMRDYFRLRRDLRAFTPDASDDGSVR
jgi:SSS family solute:Na+ symporter